MAKQTICDRCEEVIFPPAHEVKIDNRLIDICKDCLKGIEDFIKYCKHGNIFAECKECNV